MLYVAKMDAHNLNMVNKMQTTNYNKVIITYNTSSTRQSQVHLVIPKLCCKHLLGM